MPADISAFSRLRHPRRPTDESDSIDLRALFRTLWRQKWLLIGAALGLGMLAYVLTSTVAPTYSALAKVKLDGRRAVVAPRDELVSELDLSEQVVNGEAAVLRSNVLLKQVIDKMGADRLAPILELPEDGQIDQAHIDNLVWQITKDLTVYREGESYVIGIRVDGPQPVLTADLANTIAETYIENQVSSTQRTTSQAAAYLETQVAQLQEELAAAEAAVARYRNESLVADGGSLETASRQLTEMNGELVKAQSERVSAEAAFGQLKTTEDRAGIEAVAGLVTSPLIERLVAERLELERQDAVWAGRYGVEHPQRVRVRSELEQIQVDLATEVRRIMAQRQAELEQATLREATLADGVSRMEERVLAISRNALGLKQLEREASAKRQTYEALLARLTETRTLEQLQQPDAKLIERATVPGVPTAPRPKLMAAIGGMLGGAIALGLVFFFEMTASTFRSSRELEAETGLPVLASLPLTPWKSLLETAQGLAKDPYHPFGERIRHLRTALLMRDGHEKSRSILLMSAAPDDGKSTTAVALAQMTALAGKSVIVVDGDLRRSSLQRSFGWEVEEDFADFIRGDASLDRVIYSDPGFGFDFLVARGPQPEVADKLSVTWLEPVIEELKRVYDVVIIDAPAMLAVSDALVLAQVADTRVMLVRWDGTQRSAVAESLTALDELGLGVSGTVLTMVDTDRSSDGEGYGYNVDG